MRELGGNWGKVNLPIIWENQGGNKEIWGTLQKKIRTFGKKSGKFGKIRGHQGNSGQIDGNIGKAGGNQRNL